MKQKYPVVVLIGAGSRLPAVLEYEKRPDSLAKVVLVVSHKKESPGVNLAAKEGIPAVYFNLVKWRNRTGKSREEYMDTLGYFVSQYDPKLVVLAGWDLVLDENFTRYFPNATIINLHPALLTESGTGEIILPDNSKSPIFKGQVEEVLPEILKSGVTYYGCTIHEIKPNTYDEGEIIVQKSFKIKKGETVETLEEKLHKEEDIALAEALEKVLKKIPK
jgi:folate-dependent phosphoribosylglycinamide formyltransferase PurN